MSKKKKLTKSTDKVISGVCGGIAEYFNWDKTITRLVGAFLIIFPGSIIWGLLFYWVAAILMPDSDQGQKDDDSVIQGEFKEKD